MDSNSAFSRGRQLVSFRFQNRWPVPVSNNNTYVISRWLVTAAHCVGGPQSTYSIILGAHDIRSQRQARPRRYSISRIVKHPRWVNSGRLAFPNDIAMIYLSTTADMSSKYVDTVALASKNDNFVGNPNCWITGWGHLVGNGQGPDNLQVSGICGK